MRLAEQAFPIVRTAREAADLVAPLFAGLSEEKLAILHLDHERRLLGMVEGKVEAEAEINLPVRSIVADALRFGSAGIVLAHNHPSGDDAPSRADVEATRRLAAVLAELGISLRDHLVLANGRVSSFRALGLL
jgi:DNA repair protein RadC